MNLDLWQTASRKDIMKVRKELRLKMILLLILLYPLLGFSQWANHWEAIVLAENNWKYFVGISEPPSSWFQPTFNDSSWLSGSGGIGYGDNDDKTIIDSSYSVYLRRKFNIVDSTLISLLYLYADYDDAFVAYLNGVEICRANIGTVGVPPAYNESTHYQHEAKLYRGGLPEIFLIDKTQLNNGNNTLAIQVHNNSLSSSDLSSLFFLIAGIKDSSNYYQSIPSWFPEVFSSSNLPIFVINTNEQNIVDEPKITADLGVIDNGEGHLNFLTDSSNGYNGKIGIEIRGHSSQAFPKKNYGFETRLENGENNNVSLLGLPQENDWILHGPYSDKSLMRNVLSYHIGRLTGEYTPRTRWCELVINGDYKGLYVLMEKIKGDKNRVNISKLKDTDTTGIDLSGGYIISIGREEENSWSSPNYYKPIYSYHYPKYNDLAPQQRAYIKNFITQFEEKVDSSNSSEDYSDYFDIPSFVNYWIATEIFKNLDNYKFSFFMYKKRDDKGGKLHFGPLWDINQGYGNYDVDGHGPEGWSYIWARRPYLQPWMIDDLSADEHIQNQINCRWSELRQEKLKTEPLLTFIDTQATMIEDARIRNFNRWNVLGSYVWPNAFIGENYEDELTYLKTWLSERLEWMDENMVGQCSTSTSSNDDKPSLENPSKYNLYQNYPNPFNPRTAISYQLSADNDIELTIYDVTGRKIETLINEHQSAGYHTVNWNASDFCSGIYFYRLQAGDFVETKKMVQMK